jgi:hypothetical protein
MALISYTICFINVRSYLHNLSCTASHGLLGRVSFSLAKQVGRQAFSIDVRYLRPENQCGRLFSIEPATYELISSAAEK